MTVARGLTLVCRADATAATGAGHGMRLSVLAAAWKARGGDVAFHGEITIPFVQRRLAALGIAIETEAPAAAAVRVVDSYDPSVRYGRSATRVGLTVLVDDLGGPVPPGYDLVWNPNPYGRAELYPGFGGRLIGGDGAVPIRDRLPGWTPGGSETVVTIGGGEPPAAVRDALTSLGQLTSGQPFAIAGEWSPPGWRVIAPDELWTIGSRALRMVTAAGTTVWEAASVGVPVILLQTAENQRYVYRWARDAGVPGLNSLLVDAEFLAHQLQALLPAARPLPRLTSGAGRVADTLSRLARSEGPPCP